MNDVIEITFFNEDDDDGIFIIKSRLVYPMRSLKEKKMVHAWSSP